MNSLFIRIADFFLGGFSPSMRCESAEVGHVLGEPVFRKFQDGSAATERSDARLRAGQAPAGS
jgi:hypothetical protein